MHDDPPESTFGVPCGGDSYEAAVAPVPGSSDWLIAYGAGVQGGAFAVGRYRPEQLDWVVPPVEIGPRSENEALDVFAAGADALIAWGGVDERSSIVIASGLALPDSGLPPQPAMSSRSVSGAVLMDDGWYGLSQPSERSLLFGMDGEVLWAASIDAGEATRVSEIGATGVADRRPGVALVESGGLTAVCYATGPGPGGGFGLHEDGVSCVLVDGEGALLGEPLVIADGIDNIGGVDVAWSGESLLVVYWDIEMGPDPAPGSALRGQLVQLR
jgi:hypothetical protein